MIWHMVTARGGGAKEIVGEGGLKGSECETRILVLLGGDSSQKL